MKNNKIKKSNMKTIKKGMFALVAVLGIGLSAQAQQVSGNIAKQDAVVPKADPSLGGSVRVIDNKGTVKYLQVQNGLTQITNSNASGNIVTTWQLGGTLTNDTYIDATGKIFALDGIKLVPNTLAASTNATEVSKHGTATGTGYTFLVRDETTGETLKLMPSQLVVTGVTSVTVTSPGTDVNYSDAAFLPNNVSKVSVYRNGAKLLADTGNGGDYTLASGVLKIKGTGGTDPEDYSLMTTDKIEVQWIN